MPYSKIKANIAEILKAEGYIASWTVEDREDAVGKTLVVELKYGPQPRAQHRRHPARLQARPAGLRQGAPEMPRVLGGLGVAIISTSHGLLTDRQARKRDVGGEVLAYVW